nr:hypothetical protein [Romboutsia maritimum]
MIFKIRRRIETSFSQLSEQFNINQVLPKTLRGLHTRIALKILGNEDSVGKIKYLIFG